MIDISKWAFENKKLIYFLIAVLIVGGAYSSYEMSKLEDPEITVKLAMVVTTYPGASAHQVGLEEPSNKQELLKERKIVSMRQVTGWKLKNKEEFQLPLQYYNLITKDIVLIFLILQGIKTSQKIHIVL